MSDVTVGNIKKYSFSPPAECIILHEDPKHNHLKGHCFFKKKKQYIYNFIDTTLIVRLTVDETHVIKVTNALIKEDFHNQ